MKTLLSAVLLIAVSAWGQGKPAHFGGIDPINIEIRSDYTDNKGVHHDIACMEGWHMEWEPQKGTSGANTVWVAWCYKWPEEPHKPKPSVLAMRQLGPGKIHDGGLAGKWPETDPRDGACFGCDGKKGSPPAHIIAHIEPCDGWACTKPVEVPKNCQHEDEGVWPCTLMAPGEAARHIAACKQDPNEEEGCDVQQWEGWPPDLHAGGLLEGCTSRGEHLYCPLEEPYKYGDENHIDWTLPCNKGDASGEGGFVVDDKGCAHPEGWRAPAKIGICDYMDCGYTDHIWQPVITREPDKAAVPADPCSIYDYYGRCDRDSSKRHDKMLADAFSEYMSCMDQTESEGCYFRAREANGLQESDFHRYFPEGPPITDAEMYRILNERMARVGCRKEYSEEFCQTHVDAYQRFGKIYKAK